MGNDMALDGIGQHADNDNDDIVLVNGLDRSKPLKGLVISG